MKIELIEKLITKTTVIGIYGLGYVGLPLALRYTEAGYTVVGFDVDAAKVDDLSVGKSYIQHIQDEKIENALEQGLSATTDFSLTSEVDAIILCVPTPLNKYREPDLSFVTGTTDMVVPYLRCGQIISLESTTYPGTTDEELLPRVESSGFKVGADIFLVYSPEREDPGNEHFDTRTIPKIVGGCTPECLEVGKALYELAIDQVIPV